MADEPTKEQKFGCGCHIVNGVLVVECTQVGLSGEVSASRHAVAQPYSPKCSRKAQLHDAEVAARKQKADADLKAAKDEETEAATA
jgi:hypothetical protein